MEFVSNFLLFLHEHLAFLDGWSTLDWPKTNLVLLVIWFLCVISCSPRTDEPSRGGFFKRILQFIALLHLGLNCVVVYMLVTAFYGHKLGENFSLPVLNKMATANEYFFWLQFIGLVEMLLHLIRGCDNAGNSLWFRATLHFFKYVTAWNVAKSTPHGSDWLANAMQLEDCVLYLLLCLSLFIGYLVRGRTERDEDTVPLLCVPYKMYLTELAFFQAVAEIFRVRMIGLNETSNFIKFHYLVGPLVLTLFVFLRRMRSLHKIAIRDFGGAAIETEEHVHQD